MQIKLCRRQENLCLSHSLVILYQYCNIIRYAFCLLYASEKLTGLPVLMHWLNEYKDLVWGARKAAAVTLSSNVVLVQQIVPPFNITVTMLCAYVT